METRVRVWELPIRLFHWLLVLSIIGLFVTGKIGGNLMEWHRKIGFFVLGLITFRVVWGFVGGEHSRFTSFVRGPSAVFAYARSLVKGGGTSTLGHNPMGALSVLGLLAVVGFQAVSGLFVDDEILMKGPYADSVSGKVVSLMTKLHHWNSNLIIALVVLHLCAIAFYVFVKREALVKAMFTGDKRIVAEEANANNDGQNGAKMPETPRPLWLSWVCAIAVAGLTYAVTARPFW